MLEVKDLSNDAKVCMPKANEIHTFHSSLCSTFVLYIWFRPSTIECKKQNHNNSEVIIRDELGTHMSLHSRSTLHQN